MIAPGDLDWAAHAHQAIIIHDGAGKVVFRNAAADRLYGTLSDEACAGAPADPCWTGQCMRRSRDGRALLVDIWRWPLRDGTLIVEFSGPVDIMGADPAPTQRGAEVSGRFDILLEHMPVALWEVDVHSTVQIFRQLRAIDVTDVLAYFEGRPDLVAFACETVTVSRVNRAAMALLGATDQRQCLGSVRAIFEASPDAPLHVMDSHFRGLRNHIQEMRLRTLDGRDVDVLFLATLPMPPEDMSVAYLVMLEIGDRLRTEEQLGQIQREFARASVQTTMGELVSSIAHEVKQPLGAIITNCEASLRWLARSEPNLAKVRQLSGRAVEAAERAIEIIDRIQTKAALGAPTRTLLRVADMLDAAVRLVNESGETHGVTLVVERASDGGSVMGDPIQLQQVLVNLVTNSIQAFGEARGDPRITLSAVPDRGQMVITVRDNGPGFPPAHLSQVFGGFFTTKANGMGIGLTICRSIVEAHGGTITAANHPEGGAMVSIAIPLGDHPTHPGQAGQRLD